MKQTRKLIWKRWILGVLIVLNMVAIFALSAQTAEKSTDTSTKISAPVTESVSKDFQQKPQKEQKDLLAKSDKIVRKIAHGLEFGILGLLAYLFLLTWRGRVFTRYFAAMAFAVLYACSDEWHQLYVPGRSGKVSDVMIDSTGVVIACTLTLVIVLASRAKRGTLVENPKITRYSVKTNVGTKQLRIAVAADIHDTDNDLILDALSREKPDMILIPGDLMSEKTLCNAEGRGYDFLRACAELAPTYYSLGNHELSCYRSGNPRKNHTPIYPSDEVRAQIAATGAILLDNDCAQVEGITLCGLTSGLCGKENHPNADALKRFANADGYRILLCHHPEYFAPYIKPTNIELTVCGHAHGGQWRLFGRGVYAPGQGLFPQYTAGVIDDRCVISRGLGTHTIIPRIFNHPELVMITLEHQT